MNFLSFSLINPEYTAASLIMGCALYVATGLLAEELFGSTVDRVLALLILVVVGIGLYGILVLALRIINFEDLRDLYKR